ncbi:hypothetical protein U1Q18_049259 [Sarracenia purpurea var. burkii]
MVAEEGNRESTKWSFIAGDEDETRPWRRENQPSCVPHLRNEAASLYQFSRRKIMGNMGEKESEVYLESQRYVRIRVAGTSSIAYLLGMRSFAAEIKGNCSIWWKWRYSQGAGICNTARTPRLRIHQCATIQLQLIASHSLFSAGMVFGVVM